jgi:hypothetical protein
VRKTRDDLKIQLLGKSAYADSKDPIPPNTFATIGVSVCNGDSGGPVFTTNSAVTGVVSHGASCESTTARRIFTQVAPYEDVLLRPAFAYVGQQPIFEAGDVSGAGGQSGEGGGAGDPGAETGAASNGAAGHGARDGSTDVQHGAPGKGGCTCRSTASSQRGMPSSLGIGAIALGAVLVLRRRSKDAFR